MIVVCIILRDAVNLKLSTDVKAGWGLGDKVARIPYLLSVLSRKRKTQNKSTCETIQMKMSFNYRSISCKSNSFSFEWFRA